MTAKNEMPEHGKSRASVQDLAGDLATLIRHEVELAKVRRRRFLR